MIREMRESTLSVQDLRLYVLCTSTNLEHMYMGNLPRIAFYINTHQCRILCIVNVDHLTRGYNDESCSLSLKYILKQYDKVGQVRAK